MAIVVQQGVPAGLWRPGFPHHPVLRLLVLGGVLLSGFLFWMPVHADALYRCAGSRGETVFTSNRHGYHGCRKLAGYAAPAAAHARHAAAPAAARPRATPVRRDFAQVTGSVQTTAHVVAHPTATAAAGQWQYSDSGQALAAASPPGSRVLRGAVYRVVHRDGTVEYTNLPPHGANAHTATRLFSYIATCVACNLHSTIDWDSVRLHLDAYADAIRAASKEYGVDEAFLRAIIHAESAFNPRAMSLKGAQGLMQLMPATASEMGVLDAFDAAQNIRGGARYLARLLATFHGDEQLAAAAYNAGPAAVQRYHGVPPYDETRVYVQRVDTLRKRYGQAEQAPLTAMRGAAGAP